MWSVNWWQRLMQFSQFSVEKNYGSRQLIIFLQGLPPAKLGQRTWWSFFFSSLKRNSVLLTVFKLLWTVLLAILCISRRNMQIHCLHLRRELFTFKNSKHLWLYRKVPICITWEQAYILQNVCIYTFAVTKSGVRRWKTTQSYLILSASKNAVVLLSHSSFHEIEQIGLTYLSHKACLSLSCNFLTLLKGLYNAPVIDVLIR